jgi:hypothetical protein
MTGVDWNRELKKIEREYDGLPPEPSSEELRARRAAEDRVRRQNDEAAAAFGAWIRLLLVVTLAASLEFWPYPRICGTGLFGFLGAEAIVVAGGAWVTVSTWKARTPRTHALALMMTLYGIALLEIQVLPRVGYGRTDALHPAGWACAASPAVNAAH